MSALDSGRYNVAAGCVGICDGCVEASVDYSIEREQFGVPIASFQLVQEMIAEMIVQAGRAAAAPWSAAPRAVKDRASPPPSRPRSRSCSRRSAASRRQRGDPGSGGSGYVDDYPVERYLRDARVPTSTRGPRRSRS